MLSATKDTTERKESRKEARRPMPRMRQSANKSDSDIIAILVGDIHLQLKPTIARSAEPSWFEAMKRPLIEIAKLKEKHNCLVCYVGDIFNRWNSYPELINFAINWLPYGYSIAGQHDLPHHRLDDITRSAYWTLAEANRILHLGDYGLRINKDFHIRGFSWDEKLRPMSLPRRGPSEVHLALVHKYIWKPGCQYDGAPENNHVENVIPSLKGYDATAFGDNHLGFMWGKKTINCGSIMCRDVTQRDYVPRVGLLHDDGTITQKFLDISEDKWLDKNSLPKLIGIDLADVIDEFQDMGNRPLTGSFTEMLYKLIDDHKYSRRTRDALRELIEECEANE